MSTQCTETAEAMAQRLGFTCSDANPVLDIRNPFELSNWTLPVLELTVVAGAALALWWAIRRLRREGDPVNLALWFAVVAYLLIVETPLYFPEVFGIDDMIGTIFTHNVFTVQFLYDRLPLYIIALYPAMAMLAYEIVRSLGVFRSRGVVVGSLCVGFLHLCFYEIFDHLGPQLSWWTWNTGNPINRPLFDAVPMCSVLLFAAVGPALLTGTLRTMIGNPVDRGRRLSAPALVGRTLACAVLVPVGLVIVNIPIALTEGDDPGNALRVAIYVLYLVAFTVVALPVLVAQWRRRDRDARPEGPNTFVRVFGVAYLLVIAGLWATALPDYFTADHGVTVHGTPTGNLAFAAACFVIACAATLSVSAGRKQQNIRRPGPAAATERAASTATNTTHGNETAP